MNKKMTLRTWIIAIIIVVAGIIAFGLYQIASFGTIPPSVLTKNRMSNLEHDIVNHWHQSGEFITSLSELEKLKKDEWEESCLRGIIDGWGNSLLLELSNNIPVKIVSLGKDGKPKGDEQDSDLVLDIEYGDTIQKYSRGINHIYNRK